MEQLKFAGDVEIHDLSLIGKTGVVDIRQLMASISIYEDLFSPFISGKITIKESLDLINQLPLIGEEFVDIHVSTPTFEGDSRILKGRFYVYKLSDKISLKDRESLYNLYFISIEAIKDMNLRLTNAQSGYCSDIAYRLIRGDNDGLSTNKQYNIETSSNGIKFICNHWSPIRALNYTAEKSINKDGISSYLFFENRDGFNFISLNSLYKQEPLQNFIVDNYDRTPNSKGESIRDVEEDYKRAKELTMPKGFDFIDRLTKGMFNSTMTTYDLITKRFKRKYYDSVEDFSKLPHLNSNPLMSANVISAPYSSSYNSIKHTAMHNGFEDVSNTDSFLLRNAAIATAQGFRLQITVPGRTDYTVGKVVTMKTFRLAPISSSDMDTVDPMYSGRYLIASINHDISTKEHVCTMELIKDSLISGITELA
ncbi:hypothetical protein EBU71_00425 [bacterium]|nr:hypothetical protein [Candidatus Elulimicrobium humile]